MLSRFLVLSGYRSLIRLQHLTTFEVSTSCLSTSTYRLAQFYNSAREAIHDIHDGAKLLVGGFGSCGFPENLIDALVQRKTYGLVLVCNDGGINGYGAWHLLKQKQIKRFICGHTGENEELERQFFSGEIEVELTPLGTLVEKLRAGGAGIPAFFTPTGYETLVHRGGIPIKYNTDGNVALESKPKESRVFGGRSYIMEEAIKGDFALVKAWKADKAGNLIFRKTARNTNPPMCKAGRITIAEVEEIVEIGDIPKEDVHIPHIYVQRVVKGRNYLKSLSRVAQRKHIGFAKQNASSNPVDEMMRDRIVRRAALELHDSYYVNLGIGLPSLVGSRVKAGIKVYLHGDSGILGLGPSATLDNEDPDLVDAGADTVTITEDGSCFASDESFTIVRGDQTDGFHETAANRLAKKKKKQIDDQAIHYPRYPLGHLDVVILGAMEVSQYGDLASWMIPGKLVRGMGGAMDLVALDKTKVIITMEHTSKNGKPKILKECTIPLTGQRCVDMVITEMGVFETSRNEGLIMIEIADGFSVEDVKNATACEIKISPGLRPMQT